MKLSTYADHFGVTRQTATRWFHAGKIKGAYQLDTGTIIVPNDIFDKEAQAKGRHKTVLEITENSRII